MVSAVTDGEAELTENFSVVLANPISGVIGSLSATTINIANVGKLVFVTKFGLVANKIMATCNIKTHSGHFHALGIALLICFDKKCLSKMKTKSNCGFLNSPGFVLWQLPTN